MRDSYLAAPPSSVLSEVALPDGKRNLCAPYNPLHTNSGDSYPAAPLSSLLSEVALPDGKRNLCTPYNPSILTWEILIQQHSY